MAKGDAHAAGEVVVCQCTWAGRIPGAALATAMSAIEAAGLRARVIDDLCAVVARREPWLSAWAATGGRRIVACRPRAVRSLLRALAIPTTGIEVRDLSSPTAPTGVSAGAERIAPLSAPATGKGEWLPWFPVIDPDRCTSCGQCVEFCLFGVYAIEDGRVRVVAPDHCKPHCPACARICPEAAIIFPKHGQAPIDGTDIDDDEGARARARQAQHELLGRDIRAALAARRQRAAAKLDPAELRRALEARRRLSAPSDSLSKGKA